MPRPRTPAGQEYRGHHKSAAEKAKDNMTRQLARRPAPAAPETCHCDLCTWTLPPERTIIMGFATEAERDAYKAWLDDLHRENRTECVCGDDQP